MGRRRTDIWDELFEGLQFLFSIVHPAWCIPIAAIFFFGITAWFNYKVTMPGLQPIGYLIGGVPAFVTLLAGVAGWQARQKRAEFLRQRLDIDWLNGLSWRDFEKQVAEVYRERGYHVEELGGNGPDGGVDLRMRRDGLTTVVQCKRWKTYKVSVQPVRELFGVMAAENADRAIFISSGIYTQDALRFAEGKPIELIDGAQLAEMLRRFQTSLRESVESPTIRPAPVNVEIPTRPNCPKCGSQMVLRRAKTGVNAGREFWGCSTFPKCRGIRDVE